MYYPFLRARQFELIALRELASEQITQGNVVPILEPVKQLTNNLDLANKTFLASNQTAYLILNSNTGECPGDNTFFCNYISGPIGSAYLPAFHFRNNSAYIRNCLNENNLQDCLLICSHDTNSDDPDFQQLAQIPEITAFCIEDPGRNRALLRFVRNLGKSTIRLDDLFEKQTKNSDFLLIPPHRFSEEHQYYREDNFNGFADYTVLPSEYTDGGSTPRAVVIHLTYLNNQDQIWISHFTSTNDDSIANVQGKFAEAAEKALNFCHTNALNNSAIQELQEYFDSEHYPGLGTIKKISIKNHILVVADYLRN